MPRTDLIPEHSHLVSRSVIVFREGEVAGRLLRESPAEEFEGGTDCCVGRVPEEPLRFPLQRGRDVSARLEGGPADGRLGIAEPLFQNLDPARIGIPGTLREYLLPDGMELLPPVDLHQDVPFRSGLQAPHGRDGVIPVDHQRRAERLGFQHRERLWENDRLEYPASGIEKDERDRPPVRVRYRNPGRLVGNHLTDPVR